MLAIGKALQPENQAFLFLAEGSRDLVLTDSVGLSRLDGLVVSLDHPVVSGVFDGALPLSAEPAGFGSVEDALFVPLLVSGKPSGGLLVGPRKSGLAYDDQDRALLVNLARQFEMRLEQESLARADSEAARAREVMARYVSRQVADTVLHEGFDFGAGNRRDVTVMFTDIRGFTQMSEQMPPEEVVGLLNGYFSRMVAAVFDHGGTLDKFIGDGMMIVFGAPLEQPDYAFRAVQTGLRMRAELVEFNAERAAHGPPPLKIGIGIHTGDCIIGNIGTDRRLDFTAIGDTVNTASRIESLTKDYGVDILISEDTQKRIAALVQVRSVGDAPIRGRVGQLGLFALKGVDPAVPHA